MYLSVYLPRPDPGCVDALSPALNVFPSRPGHTDPGGFFRAYKSSH